MAHNSTCKSWPLSMPRVWYGPSCSISQQSSRSPDRESVPCKYLDAELFREGRRFMSLEYVEEVWKTGDTLLCTYIEVCVGKNKIPEVTKVQFHPTASIDVATTLYHPRRNDLLYEFELKLLT